MTDIKNIHCIDINWIDSKIDEFKEEIKLSESA